jgi:hypothetical protein
MNKQNIPVVPDENRMEELLGKIQPVPGENFHQKMKQAAWRTENLEYQKKSIRTHRVRVALALTVVLIFAGLLMSPQGRALAQNILQFFVRTDSDTLLVPTEPVVWVEPRPSARQVTKTTLPAIAIFAAECGDFPNPTCSVEEIREKVDFTVQELHTIPERLYFMGATGGPDSIFLKYEFENHSGGLVIFEERWREASFGNL